ncbi:LCP family protein [Alteribacillus sp. YIM 98480]|uniref:LCP family protein n=1 Tax=Alteribacillus sp. YIM 98480 TaxID=2606599 RepID=UPI00131CEE7F|nr:LCP family protein [Alteribacillus sp. YIM 98480]
MWKAALFIFITVFFAVVAAGAGYAYYLYNEASENVEKMNQSYTEEVGISGEARIDSLRGSVSFLIGGIGERPGEPGLADVIMAVSINPEDESMLLFNIPRDTQVSIPGRNKPEKINHAYSYGGMKLVKETTEQKLQHSFDFVVEANMQGFQEIVDALGGVEVDNAFAFSQNNVGNTKTHHYDKGLIELNGERALDYVRMRKKDPRGDLGRNERQQQVLKALLQKTRSVENLLNGQDMLNILGENVKTNMTMDDIRTLFTSYRSALNYTRSFELAGENDTQDGVSYYLVSEQEWQKASLRLENHQQKQ